MSIPGVMTKFKIAELSGVDRPAQKGARVAIMKREFSDEQRQHAAQTGAAMSDGSYPIENRGDLENAIHAIGRGKNNSHAAIRSHIIRRAHALGATSLLPDGWVDKSEELEMSKELRKALGLAENATEADVINALVAKSNKSDEERDAEKKRADEAEKAAKAAGLEACKAKMTDKEKAHTSGWDDDKVADFMAKPKEDRDSAMDKAAGDFVEIGGVRINKSAVDPGVLAILKSQDEKIASQATEIAKANAAAGTARFMKMATEEFDSLSGTVDERAAMLKGIYDIPDEASRNAALAGLRTANAAARGAFTWMGKGAGGHGDGFAKGGADAEAELKKKAEEIKKASPSLTFEKAYEQALEQNPDLYAKAKSEQAIRVAKANGGH